MSAIHGDECYHEAEPATWRYVLGLATFPTVAIVAISSADAAGLISHPLWYWVHGMIVGSFWQLAKHDPHINAWYVQRHDNDR